MVVEIWRLSRTRSFSDTAGRGTRIGTGLAPPSTIGVASKAPANEAEKLCETVGVAELRGTPVYAPLSLLILIFFLFHSV